MGIVSFLTSFRASKTREKTPRPQPSPPVRNLPREPSPRRRPAPQARVERGLERPPKAASRAWAATEDDDDTYIVVREKRSSRRFSLSRRSWFGGSPDDDDNEIPAVPRLVHTASQHRNGQPVRPETKGTSNSGQNKKGDAVDVRSKRFSLARTSSRKSKKAEDPPQSILKNRSSLVRPPSLHRLSWRSSKHDSSTTIQAVPPLPPMPVALKSTANIPATSSLPTDKRRSRAGSIKSVHRSSSTRRKSLSLWTSSNPDDSEYAVPRVPRMVRDTYAFEQEDDTRSNRSSLDSIGYPRTAGTAAAAKTTTTTTARKVRGDDDHHPGREREHSPRPTSVSSRKSYRPRSAAKGFLASTKGASDDTRKSYRVSFRLDENADLVCLTDEQQIEWAKLMNEEAKFQNSSYRSTPAPLPLTEAEKTAAMNGTSKYSNAQALAALEFGLRS